MSCRDVRRRLDDPAGAADARVQAHLEDCTPCARLASRLEQVRGALQRRHAGISPDPQFAARVAGNVTDSNGEQLAWAALRLLPGTVVLVLLLSWFAWRNDVPVVQIPAQAPTDDLLNWVATRSPETP